MLVNKILNVMEKIGPIIKDKTNTEKGFDYASLAIIMSKAREAMIEEKMVMIPYKIEQIVQRGNDVIISMVYRFLDAEPGKDGKNEYMDVNVVGEGFDKDGWAAYKALSGAYKYAITQTFAIPTVDDAEKSKITNNNEMEKKQLILEDDELDENEIERILGEPTEEDFENVFGLGAKAG